MYYYQSLFYVKDYIMFCVVFNKMNLNATVSVAYDSYCNLLLTTSFMK